MGDERLTDLCPAGDHLNEPGRQVVERLHHGEQGERREFRRLHDDGVARPERGRRLPPEQQHRKVERHDRHDGAERLFQHHVYLSGNRRPGDSALLVARDFRVVTESRCRRAALPVRLTEGLAHFAREHLARRASHRQHAVSNLVHGVGAVKRTHRPPLTLRARRGRERLVDLIWGGMCELAGRPTRRGVDDRRSLA